VQGWILLVTASLALSLSASTQQKCIATFFSASVESDGTVFFFELKMAQSLSDSHAIL
jgi:hypothetical protein